MDNIEEAARALLDARITSVKALVTARQNLADLRDQVAQAEREDARLYAAALRDGWTADELRKLGLAESEKPARRSSRSRSRGSSKKTAPPSPASAPVTHEPAAAAAPVAQQPAVAQAS